MDQQRWIITFKGEEDDIAQKAGVLEQQILSASPHVEVTRRQKDRRSQGGPFDLLITLVGPSGIIIAIVHAITVWIKATHSISIDIEVEGVKIKIQNVTKKNCDKELPKLLNAATEAAKKRKK